MGKKVLLVSSNLQHHVQITIPMLRLGARIIKGNVKLMRMVMKEDDKIKMINEDKLNKAKTMEILAKYWAQVNKRMIKQ